MTTSDASDASEAFAGAASVPRAQVLYMFNKVYFDFIKDVKKTVASTKPVLKEHYKVVKLLDEDTLREFSGFMERALPVLVSCPQPDVLAQADVLAAQVFKGGITVKQLVEGMPAASLNTITTYLYILAVLMSLHTAGDDDATAKVLHLLAQIQNAEADDNAIRRGLEDILDDDIVFLLTQLRASFCSSVKLEPASAAAAGTGGDMPDFGALADAFQNSKIGSIAKEISEELDLSELQRPEDVMNLSNMGSIVGKVGSKIQSKIASGDLKQEDLTREVMSFMSSMGALGGGGGTNNFFNIAKNVAACMQQQGGGGAAAAGAAAAAGGQVPKGAKTSVNEGKLRTLTTKERLRRKLEERQKTDSGQ